MTDLSTQVVVVGGGPGGYAAAFLAADLGMQVTLVDPAEYPGGVCLYRGCIPSKALLHAAKLIGEARDAAAFGLHFGEPKIDLDELRGWKESVVHRLVSGLGQLGARRKVQHLRGMAKLTGPETLEVALTSGETRSLRFESAVLATGSRPLMLRSTPQSPRVMDSTGALALEDVPRELLVVGGGYIGLEIGTVYARLGSRVTVVEMTGGLLPGADADLVRPLARRLEELFGDILLNTRVARLEDTGDGVEVELEGEKLENPKRRFDRVLMSVGRRPNSEEIGLESTRVEVDEQGFVRVDAQRRTAEPRIWAIGDVAGQPMLAHKASHEGRVAVEAISGQKVVFEPWAIPAVVFTDPEIAWCGLTETDAAQLGRKVSVARFPWAASGRAITLDRPEGVTKLVIDPETEQVLGVGITGAGAGELIAEGVLAVEMGAVAKDLALAIHQHPTLSETLMEAAEVFYGQSTHVYRPRRSR